MKINSLLIKNFKTIKELNIDDIENAMIIVGKNSTGKTTVLHAILAASGQYVIKESDFNRPDRRIEIAVNLEITDEDINKFYKNGIISKYKSFDMWLAEFCKVFPTYKEHNLSYVFVAETDLNIRYSDGITRNNPYIAQILPKVHFIDSKREVEAIQDDIFLAQTMDALTPIKESKCLNDPARPCTNCFECIPCIFEKTPEELSISESLKLMEYKFLQLDMNSFIKKLNNYYTKNSGRAQNIKFVMNVNTEDLFKIDTVVLNKERYSADSVKTFSAGAKSIYILSLLEAYIEESKSIPCIIMMEDPEIYLHPQLQKVASEILYRLSKKNQLFFSTHSPNLIFNFNSKQIKQVTLDEDYNTTMLENTDIDNILDDLGYTANDMMNVNFVFIVEGKQDSNRLPLLLKKYYSEVYGEDGRLQRISIINTNSCTNIKTYANLKYMNKLYLKDQFLMIRDSDGKKPETLVKQLCTYYYNRGMDDPGNIPRIQPKNVLVLKYYSFENYFLNPKTMVKIGVLNNEEEFYNILLQKFKSYLNKHQSVRRMKEITGLTIKSKDDLKKNMTTIKTFVRGHNLFDIFYGKYKGDEETEILNAYIENADRSEFADILDAIDNFIYFKNRKIDEEDSSEETVPRQKHKKKSKKNRNPINT